MGILRFAYYGAGNKGLIATVGKMIRHYYSVTSSIPHTEFVFCVMSYNRIFSNGLKGRERKEELQIRHT